MCEYYLKQPCWHFSIFNSKVNKAHFVVNPNLAQSQKLSISPSLLPFAFAFCFRSSDLGHSNSVLTQNLRFDLLLRYSLILFEFETKLILARLKFDLPSSLITTSSFPFFRSTSCVTVTLIIISLLWIFLFKFLRFEFMLLVLIWFGGVKPLSSQFSVVYLFLPEFSCTVYFTLWKYWRTCS